MLNVVMASQTSGHLRRVLGVGFGLAVSIGGTIGVGILRTPGLVAGQLHVSSLIVFLWLAGGIYTLLGASCLTELGLMLPRAGGFYVYIRRAFGNTAGFAVGWTDWLMYCSILGYLSIAIVEFIAALGLIPGGAIRFLSVLILVSMVALQWLGIRISSLFQEVTTSIKCVAFLVLVAACLLVPSGRYPSARILPSMTFTGFVIALQAIVITYGGWQSPLYFIEEDRDPARNLPRTMIGGVLSVIGIYLLVNIALLKVLPMSELSGATFPAADAARVIAGAHGRNVIILLSVISLVPLLNAVAMMGTRVIFAMGRDQLWWAYGQLELLRLYCVNLARLRQDFTAGTDGYEKVDRALPVEQLSPLQATFCPLERGAMLQAALVIVRFYRELAPVLARTHGIPYPDRLDAVMYERLGRLCETPAA